MQVVLKLDDLSQAIRRSIVVLELKNITANMVYRLKDASIRASVGKILWKHKGVFLQTSHFSYVKHVSYRTLNYIYCYQVIYIYIILG